MAELKNIRVREAKGRDIGLFRKLWTLLIQTQCEQGSGRDLKALALYEHLFNRYVAKEADGIVLFVADKGVLMWGDHGPLDVYAEKTVASWGDYSDGNPEIKTALLAHAEEWAKSCGYVNVLYETFGAQQAPEGFCEIGTMFKKRL
jgi:hypothetical protein